MRPLIQSLLKFYNKLVGLSVIEKYDVRLKLFENSLTVEDFLFHYVKIEPHGFLHAGFLSNMLKKNNLEGAKTISIGMDLLKEIVLIKNNFLNINTFDIDLSAVNAGNDIASRLGINKSLTYICENIIETKRINDNYKLAILSQMDYLLSDDQLKELASIFSKNAISDIIILSPSVFQFSINPAKNLEFIFKFLYIIRSIFRYSHKENTYYTYVRNIRYLRNLFSKFYEVNEFIDYRYPYGRIFLLHLKILN